MDKFIQERYTRKAVRAAKIEKNKIMSRLKLLGEALLGEL